MIPIVFFGLWSLGPLTVMGIKRSWLVRQMHGDWSMDVMRARITLLLTNRLIELSYSQPQCRGQRISASMQAEVLWESVSWVFTYANRVTNDVMILRFFVNFQIDPNSSREGLFYLDNPTCEKLKCALPRPEGGYSLVKLGPPVDGTFCGILQVSSASFQ